MTPLATYFASFVNAVRCDRSSGLNAFAACAGELRGVRIHQNNSSQAISSALASNYPAVVRLIGDECFDTVATAFVRQEFPRSRSLVGYGEEFPGFLERFAAGTSTPYIADIARLDRGWLEAHIAPDAPTLRAGDLAELDSDALRHRRINLHPSARLLQTTWSVYDVWLANRIEGGKATTLRAILRDRQSILIWRSNGVIRDRLLTPAAATFLDALMRGKTLGEAVEAASSAGENAGASGAFAGALASDLFEKPQYQSLYPTRDE